jgi:glutamyl-tRNA synthetase
MTTDSPRLLTRIAPTPSGYLHEGNLLNFLLTQRLAREVGAQIALRIDDMDVFRMRPEFVEDIFRCLRWLDIAWQHGPQSMAEYEDLPAPEDRADHYYDMLDDMVVAGLPAFICKCSRRDLGRNLRCEQGCAEKRLELVARRIAVRVHIPEDEAVLARAFGDVTMWRREDLPAYQLASLVDDHEMAVTHIVRGADLRDSTALQLYLARFLPDSPFLRADIRHHDLVTGEGGTKLSKSQGTERLQLTPELRARLDALLATTVLRSAQEELVEAPRGEGETDDAEAGEVRDMPQEGRIELPVHESAQHGDRLP